MAVANNRIFYACQAVAISPHPDTDSGSFVITHGVQSVGVNTSFNLEQAFELGQISIYENIEGLPEVEVTLEKVLDGYPLLYRLATMPVTDPSPKEDDLVGRTKNRCCVALGIYEDSKPYISGTPITQIYMSGMYINAVNYTLPTDGNCTESVTLVGNHKVWYKGTDNKTTPLTNFGTNQADKLWNHTWGPDKPVNNQTGYFAGGVQRRENVIMMSSVFPSSIFGIGGGGTVIVGTGNNYRDNKPIVHIQNITIGADMGRENILELGQKFPYYRAAKFPIEVTSEFEVIALSGDFVSAYEKGDPDFVTYEGEGNNTNEEKILLVLQDGTKFDLGQKNRLSAVTYGGADAGGGNATIKYSYSTYNDLTITPPHATAGVGYKEREV